MATHPTAESARCDGLYNRSHYKLRVTIGYEDNAGYKWQRTDTSQPTRTDEETWGGSPVTLKEPR